jgi:hypothetical protein
MKVKSNTNDYLQIEYFWASYEGGAHDNYGYSERVFDLQNNKKLELKDITSMPKEKLEALLMKNINRTNSGTTDDKGEVNNSEMLLVDKIPATENFILMTKTCISITVRTKLQLLQQEILPFLFPGQNLKELYSRI